ncbi:iron ABC transporter permease [Pusillimonas sp. T2]|uniref:FecCD family ABC transporter permease n=1 Tax=Pusillimonas sp. T2 TaxID=1548123 RepID=UPI0020B13792|nr:iron ABC transporter permease [Pusillimonas sp. T2]
MMASLSGGAFDIPLARVGALITGASSGSASVEVRILFELRLPRVLLSAIVGAALAASGVLMQALFRNPLAEPGLVGVSSGAALGAVIAIVLFPAGAMLVGVSAFLGSLLATSLAYVVGSRQPGIAGLLLAGIAINTVAGSLIGLFTYMADDTQLRDLTFWSMGSLAAAQWSTVAWLVPWVLVLLVVAGMQWRMLNALLLGHQEAMHLGYQQETLRRRLIVLTALVVGPLVAVTGGIGFIGLVVPHLVRMLVGANHRVLLPMSMLVGAVFLAAADWWSRVIVAPAELPIGLVTSLVGGPFFFWLLSRKKW